MNWGDGASPQTRDAFLVEWDRDFVPSSGDSSHAAGARLASLLDELARRGRGGVTVYLLRNLFDERDVPLTKRK
jgi:hypothetical protein